jgi:hypothetical protein
MTDFAAKPRGMVRHYPWVEEGQSLIRIPSVERLMLRRTICTFSSDIARAVSRGKARFPCNSTARPRRRATHGALLSRGLRKIAHSGSEPPRGNWSLVAHLG